MVLNLRGEQFHAEKVINQAAISLYICICTERYSSLLSTCRIYSIKSCCLFNMVGGWL